jgi:hypothetical protein
MNEGKVGVVLVVVGIVLAQLMLNWEAGGNPWRAKALQLEAFRE